MSDWPGVSSCRLVREGSPRNGLGAVREVVGNGLTLLEEVVAYLPLEGYDYKITKGLPVDHLGSVRLKSIDDGVRLTWNIRMSSRWPFGLRPSGPWSQSWPSQGSCSVQSCG